MVVHEENHAVIVWIRPRVRWLSGPADGSSTAPPANGSVETARRLSAVETAIIIGVIVNVIALGWNVYLGSRRMAAKAR